MMNLNTYTNVEFQQKIYYQSNIGAFTAPFIFSRGFYKAYYEKIKF